jgi:hypothetical protein
MTIQARAIYTSSSGNTWFLCRSPKGEIVMSHQANDAPGGKPSEVDLSTFLAKGNTGPEHQALRELIGELIVSNPLQADYDDHD